MTVVWLSLGVYVYEYVGAIRETSLSLSSYIYIYIYDSRMQVDSWLVR